MEKENLDENKEKRNEEKQTKDGKMKSERRFTSMTIKFIALAVIMVAAASIVSNICDRQEPKITDTFIDSKMESVSDLISAKMVYNGLIKYSNNKIPFITEDAFSMIYRAEISAGIDISKADAKVHRKNVVITLPKAEIKSIDIDESSLEFYDKNFALFKTDSKENVKEAVKKAKQDVEENGDIESLKEKADKQAVKIIKALLEGNIGKRELEIKYK